MISASSSSSPPERDNDASTTRQLIESNKRKREDEFRKLIREKVIEPKRQKNDLSKQLCEDLLNHDNKLDNLLERLQQEEDSYGMLSDVCKDYCHTATNHFELGVMVNELFTDLKKFKVCKDTLWETFCNIEHTIGKEDVLKYCDSVGFCEAAANNATKKDVRTMIDGLFHTDPKLGKLPKYAAFSGASGSGKTHTMLWTARHIVKEKLPKGIKGLMYYSACELLGDQGLFEYVKGRLETVLALSTGQDTFTSDYKSFADFEDQCKKTWLVLVLDEAPNRFSHNSYYELPTKLEQTLKFGRVVLIAGSTAISRDVCRQPTTDFEVINIRMGPLSEEIIPDVLLYHLKRKKPQIKDHHILANQLFQEMPLLHSLMANHRCAMLTVNVLDELLGKEVPMRVLPNGWCQGHSSTLLSMVACKYRELNGLRLKTPEECQRIMLESLALLAVQPVVDETRGVDKVPAENSLAVLAEELLETGLVERAVLPDDRAIVKVEDGKKTTHTLGEDKIKVDGRYEFQMSPALILLCVSVVVPWIEGIYSAPDHFKALVAALMVALRYAKTEEQFEVKRLEKGVPYSGSENHLFHQPEEPLTDKCFINGPQAPYGDVMLASAGTERRSGNGNSLLSALARLTDESGFPNHPILMQCKHTINPDESNCVKCNFRHEFAKMGFVHNDGEISSEEKNPYGHNEEKNRKRYMPGRWLTEKWVKCGDKNRPVSLAFATNAEFENPPSQTSNLVLVAGRHAGGSHAWKELYPVKELVRTAAMGEVKRIATDPDTQEFDLSG